MWTRVSSEGVCGKAEEGGLRALGNPNFFRELNGIQEVLRQRNSSCRMDLEEGC